MFGLTINIPSGKVFLLTGYNYVKTLFSWLTVDSNVILIFQVITILLSLNVIMYVFHASKSQSSLKKQLSAFIYFIHILLIQIFYLFLMLLLKKGSDSNIQNFYFLLTVLYVTGLCLNYIIPKYVHSLYSVDKRRDYIFLLLTIFLIILFFLKKPFYIKNSEIYTYYSKDVSIIVNVLGLIINFYIIYVALKYSSSTSCFLKNITRFILAFFTIRILQNIYFIFGYRETIYLLSIENVSVAILSDTILIFIVNAFSYFSYAKLFKKELLR